MASDREKVRTAYRMAGEYVRRTRPGGRVFIVHRLDRDTSGVLLFAKDEEAKRAYQEHWDALVRRPGLSGGGGGPGPPGRRTPSAPFCGRTPPTRSTPSAPAAGSGDHYRTHPGGAGVHPAGGGHRHRAQEPDPRPPERAGLPRGGRPGLRRGRQPAGPPVPPRPRAGPDRPLHRGGAEVPLRGPPGASARWSARDPAGPGPGCGTPPARDSGRKSSASPPRRHPPPGRPTGQSR